MTMKIAPSTAPCRLKAPPIRITMMNSIESCRVNISGLMKDSLWANRTPANPVMAALIANDLTL